MELDSNIITVIFEGETTPRQYSKNQMVTAVATAQQVFSSVNPNAWAKMVKEVAAIQFLAANSVEQRSAGLHQDLINQCRECTDHMKAVILEHNRMEVN